MHLAVGVMVLVGGCQLPQDDALAERVRKGVEELCAENIESREKAGQGLRELGVPALPTLEALLKQQKEVEAHARIRSVIKDIWTAEANKCFSEGRLKDSLLAQANADNPSDPKGHYRTRLDQAQKALLLSIDQTGSGLVRPAGPSGSGLREKHGRWILPSILDCLNPQGLNRPVEVPDLLKDWAAEIVPILVASLGDKNDRFVAKVCDLFLYFGRGQSSVRKGLADLVKDQSRGEGLRSLARDILVELGGKPE